MSADGTSEMGEIEGKVDGLLEGSITKTKSSILIGLILKNSV